MFSEPALQAESKEEQHEKKLWSSDMFYEFGLTALTMGQFNTNYLFEELSVWKSAFFPMFLIQSIVVAIPITVLELSISQYVEKGMTKIWHMCPIFSGISFCYAIFVFFNQVALCDTMTYLMMYFMASFSSKTGWDRCDNDWNTVSCYTFDTNFSRRLDCYENFGIERCNQMSWESAPYQYWTNNVLRINIGFVQGASVGYCCIVFAIAILATFKGIVMIENCIRVCIITSAVMFCIIFYTSVLQYGAGLGIKKIAKFHWEMWKDPMAWIKTCQNMLCTMTLGLGPLRSMGSQNRFRGNSYMNAMMVVLVGITSTFLHNVLFFSMCGNLSYNVNQPVDAIIELKEPIFFAKIPRVLFRWPKPRELWIALFFSHMFLLYFVKFVVSSFLLTRVTQSLFPNLYTYKYAFWLTTFNRYLITFALCIALFTKQGLYWLEKIITLTYGGPCIFLLNFIQLAVILYIYGIRRAIDDLHFMFGFRLHIVWQILLPLIPIYLLAMWIYSVREYYLSKEYKTSTIYLALFDGLLMYSPIWMTLLYAIYYFFFKIKRKWRIMFKPHDAWCLKDRTLMKSRDMFTASSMTKEYLYRQQKRKEADYFEQYILRKDHLF